MSEKSPRRPVLLVILDGFGVNPSNLNNAIAQANTPRLDDYFSRYSHTLLQASGAAVELPDGQMGNSEVGHLTMGCGDIVQQDLVHIDEAITDVSFFENTALTAAVESARNSERPLHRCGSQFHRSHCIASAGFACAGCDDWAFFAVKTPFPLNSSQVFLLWACVSCFYFRARRKYCVKSPCVSQGKKYLS